MQRLNVCDLIFLGVWVYTSLCDLEPTQWEIAHLKEKYNKQEYHDGIVRERSTSSGNGVVVFAKGDISYNVSEFNEESKKLALTPGSLRHLVGNHMLSKLKAKMNQSHEVKTPQLVKHLRSVEHRDRVADVTDLDMSNNAHRMLVPFRRDLSSVFASLLIIIRMTCPL